MMRCACLVHVRDNALLLVRVRENALWYLPGGKIEEGEAPRSALLRELDEELGLALSASSLTPLFNVIGPAYGVEGDVELVCFASDHPLPALRPANEISAVDWLPLNEPERMAPAVRLMIRRHLQR
ncbi:NUDIX hydrolase [Chitinibacteraceae bacterium HSL-7]